MTQTEALTENEGVTADPSMSERPPRPKSQAALRAFGNWRREETGAEFHALFHACVPETPRADV